MDSKNVLPDENQQKKSNYFKVEDLVQVLNDSIHIEVGVSRSVKAVRSSVVIKRPARDKYALDRYGPNYFI
jgi:hypothetical protein